MPPRRNVHELSPSGSSSPAETAPASAEGSVFSQDGDDLLGGVREDTGSLAPSAVVELPDRGGAGQDRDDGAGSSASEATAVAAGLPGNLGGRIRERVREIENELSRFLSESSNKVPVPARNFIMSRVFELAAFCSDLREDAAASWSRPGGREVAVLQRRVHEAESGLPGAVAADLSTRRADAPGLVPAAAQGALSYAAVLAGPGAAARGPRLPGREPAGEVIPEVWQEQHQHVAFLTPTSQTAAPARDVLRLRKTNIDPASKGITDVTLLDKKYSTGDTGKHGNTSPVWWDQTRPDCRLLSRVVSIQRAALLGLLGAYRTTRITALQALFNAPPIALELERANVEYDLVVRRRQISYGEVSFRLDEVLPPVDVWQKHPAARMSYQSRRLTRDGARRMASAPGMHVYTDMSYSDRLAELPGC
ncbi:hypothetical protein HPB50_007823 [Hyalomma asiaticum]|uniref:Uncharacterized protein n=1 Tax=Hyalomma asiaticum TaxID=266040 RepID=A0ACB7T3W2_HYAAI|nr:hypothetical protein HPB50_007823 [Hyalomma asiaticum]